MILALGLVALLLLFRETTASAMALWANSSAYNYAYIIAPIAAYVAWVDRARIAHLAPQPCLWGLAVAIPAAIGWLAADLLDIDEGRHLALVAIMQALFLGVLGPQVYRAFLFPFLYLFLLVPTGEWLIAPLQWIGHAGSVVLLRLSDIPTYTEGMLIEVPHGRFLVEPGCAGLNFLLASLALSLLYGKLTYRTLRARVICVAVGLATSVFANVIRIYLIVAVTEWSRRYIDIADDHLLYGWGFFSVIMLGMMWLGGRFAKPAQGQEPPRDRAPVAAPRLGLVAASAIAVLAVAAAPVAFATLLTPDEPTPQRLSKVEAS